MTTLAIHIVFIPALFIFGVYTGWQLREAREEPSRGGAPDGAEGRSAAPGPPGKPEKEKRP